VLSDAPSTLHLMEGWALAIAIFSTVIATASLTWNVVQFLLGGARPRAQLIVGALSDGGGLVSGQPSEGLFRTLARLTGESYTHPVIGVKVINCGRAPARVQNWSVKCIDAGVALTPVGDSIGPELPHDLPAGANETWVVDLRSARAMVHASATATHGRTEPVRVVVELGTGKILVSSKSLSIADNE
jgi:hypothetical protein